MAKKLKIPDVFFKIMIIILRIPASFFKIIVRQLKILSFFSKELPSN
jgi:hypothetical protein